uniref:Lipocalin n=1 Tax=Rhipicephalus zambeziensis TaxID=60191 RepID=A0A224YLD7_9ACAR
MLARSTKRSATFFMPVFSALILWASAVTSLAIHNPFDQLKLDLSRYQDPWPVINSSLDLYLARATGLPQNITCVRSRYWGYDETDETVHRSLNFLSNNGSSLNMSINVEYYGTPPPMNLTFLNVTFTITQEKEMLPGVGPNHAYYLGEYTFLVLYGDRRCLLLASMLDKPGAPRCSLWFPKNRSGRPPACCEFLFFILCGQGNKVYQPSCKRYES